MTSVILFWLVVVLTIVGVLGTVITKYFSYKQWTKLLMKCRREDEEL